MIEPFSTLPDYDSPWKEILDENFEECIAFFFPKAHLAIDWSKGYEFLDKELQQITADAAIGRRVVDKLVKVWLNDGREQWVLIHIEVQGKQEADFELRLYTYHYRIFDRYGHHVATFAILTDEDTLWRPTEFRYELLGTLANLRFSTSKLLDYKPHWAELELSTNPFAVVVMAHLKTIESKSDLQIRYHWKWILTRMLYERGYDKLKVIRLFRFIDWIMNLSADLQQQFHTELHEFEEEQRMPYVTTIERLGREEGLIDGRVEGRHEHALQTADRFARHKFGTLQGSTVQQLSTLTIDQLDALIEALFEMPTIDKMNQWLVSHTTQ